MLFGKYINQYYKKYAFLLIIGIVALIAVNWINLYIPELIGKIINIIDINPQLSTENINEIIVLGLYILLVGIGVVLGRVIWRLTLFRASNRIEADLRQKMFLKAEKLSANYYYTHKIGDIMSYFTNDLEIIEEHFGFGTVMLVDAIFATTFTIIKMSYLDWSLTIISMIPLLLVVVWGLLVVKYMSQKWAYRQNAYDHLYSFTQENFSGIRVIKAFVKETYEILAFSKIAKKNSDINISFSRTSILFQISIGIIISLCISLVLGFGCWFVLSNATGRPIYIFGKEIKLTVATLLQFIVYFNMIILPLVESGQIIPMFSRSKTSLGRISNFLDSPIDIKDDKNAISLNNVKGKITYKNLSFKYPNSKTDSIHNISLTINEGETIGIVGKTGCGKTTLVNCLLRIYNIPNKSVFIDDIDVMKIKIKSLREIISYAPQDVFLFSDTVANNISFSNINLPFQKIKESADFAAINTNIESFANSYKTMTGERGVSLSGGQKQRISISRAYIKNSPIMILDDSTSAVDVSTEDIILNNIKKYRKGMTTIIVSSRISTVKNLNRIIVLNNGVMEAFGNHKTLLAKSPTYKKMVQLQELEKMRYVNENNKK